MISGLVSLYIYIHIEYFVDTCLAQEPRDLVSALSFKVSPMISQDPILNYKRNPSVTF